jgi:hypothetical protein
MRSRGSRRRRSRARTFTRSKRKEIVCLARIAAGSIGTTADERDKLEKLAAACSAGTRCPWLDCHRPAVGASISQWLFWDDAQVEEESGWTVDSMIAARTRADPLSRIQQGMPSDESRGGCSCAIQ